MKRIVLSIFALVLVLTSLFGVSQVFAQSNSNTYLSGLAQTLAQKFGLDQSQVQSVLDSYKGQQQASRQQNMQNRLKSKLDAEVSAGKITSAQEAAIIGELNTLKSQNNPSAFRNMTQQQRQQVFQDEQNQLKSWASSQGIDISLIPGGLGFRGGMHKGG